MDKLLDEFVCTITDNNGDINLTYSLSGVTGMCQYNKVEMRGKNKPLIQRIYVMTQCDMVDVIDYIHRICPLNEGEYDRMNMLIRNHSLSKVQDLDR
jgi:hypothetical protein